LVDASFFFAGIGMMNAIGGKHPLTCGGLEMTTGMMPAAHVEKTTNTHAFQKEVFIRNTRHRFAILDGV